MDKLRVLLVDDEVGIQEFLVDALIEAGFDVSACANGASALELLETNPFQAVITDIKLGAGPDGWDVAHRARELIPDVPIVYVTGSEGHEWTSKGVPLSVLVVKPFALAQIVTAVSSLLNTTG